MSIAFRIYFNCYWFVLSNLRIPIRLTRKEARSPGLYIWGSNSLMLQWKFDRRINHVKPGNVIQMNVEGSTRKCFVTDVFDYFVKARYRAKGKIHNASFTIGELVQAGYEPKGVL